MKKNFCIGKMAAMALMSVMLMLVAGCNKKEAPSAPTDLSAELNNDCIHLSWKEVPHADYYRITVGFQIRNNLNVLLNETREISLGEVSGTEYDDCFPFEGTNYYKIEAVNEYGSSPCSEVSCYYPVNETVFMYPNLSTDNVSVEVESMNRIIVSNLDGETLADLEMDCDICTLSLAQFGSGVYIIHIFSNLGETIKRIVIV